MTAINVVLYRFAFSARLGREPPATGTAVWVSAEDPAPLAWALNRSLRDTFGVEPSERGWLRLRVDLEPARAERCRTAAETYLGAVRDALLERQAALDRPPWFGRKAHARRARSACAAALASADAAYEPVRAEASRLLDEAYAPIETRRRAITAIATMRIWRFERRGRHAHVHATPSGLTADELLRTIMREDDIVDFWWEADAVAKAEEVLGAGGFLEWWNEFAGPWKYRMQQRRDGDRYRPGGSGTAGTGGFGI